MSVIKQAKADTLILGCTHFPLLAPIIRQELGDTAQLIDSGRETARICADYLHKNGLLSEQKEGRCRFFVSDQVDGFRRVAKTFLGHAVEDDIQTISPERT